MKIKKLKFIFSVFFNFSLFAHSYITHKEKCRQQLQFNTKVENGQLYGVLKNHALLILFFICPFFFLYTLMFNVREFYE